MCRTALALLFESRPAFHNDDPPGDGRPARIASDARTDGTDRAAA
jgi:hypothetical protein